MSFSRFLQQNADSVVSRNFNFYGGINMKKTVKSLAALFLCVSSLCLFCACAIPSDEDYGSNESGALATKASDDSAAPVTE